MVSGLRSTVYLSFLLIVLELGDRCYVSGSCPPSIRNGYITYCDLSAGSQCYYLCNLGYVRNPSIDKLKCNGQAWEPVWFEPANHTLPWCIPMSCPKLIPNGDLNPGCQALVGTSCPYTCHDGFKQTSNVTSCTEQSRWWPDALWLCESVIWTMCPFLIVNGDLELSCSRRHGAVCNFTCHDRYSPTQSVMTCMADGKWDASPNTVCQDIRCPEVIPNGMISPVCIRKADEYCISFTCNDGYIRNPNMYSVLCLKGGKWDKKNESFCLDLLDFCPKYVRNGEIRAGCSRVVGNDCAYYCYPGYQRNPYVDKVECLSSQMWRNSAVLCGAERCSDHLPNGMWSQSCDFLPARNCSYQCLPGFWSTTRKSTVTCMPDGQWQRDHRYICVPKANRCPLKLPNGRFEDGCKPDIGSSCSYECDHQHVKHDSVSQPLCLATGNWSVNVYTLCALISIDPCCETGSSMVGLISCAVVVMLFIIIMIVACRIRENRRRTRNRNNSREQNFVAVFVVNGGSRSVENTVTLSRPPDYLEILDPPAYALLDRSVAGGAPPEYESLHFEEKDYDNAPPAYTPLTVQADDSQP